MLLCGAASSGVLVRRVPPLEVDRFLLTDLVAAHVLIVSCELLRVVEAAVGPLEA